MIDITAPALPSAIAERMIFCLFLGAIPLLCRQESIDLQCVNDAVDRVGGGACVAGVGVIRMEGGSGGAGRVASSCADCILLSDLCHAEEAKGVVVLDADHESGSSRYQYPLVGGEVAEDDVPSSCPRENAVSRACYPDLAKTRTVPNVDHMSEAASRIPKHHEGISAAA